LKGAEMTHKQMLKQIDKIRKVMHKRLVDAIGAVARGEKELNVAVRAFHKVHQMAQTKNKHVKPKRHQSLIDEISKRQQKLVDLRDKNLEVEKEHKAYFHPLK
jgi:hypothetical protein